MPSLPPNPEALRPLKPEEKLAAKPVVGFDVDTAARLLYVRSRGPLDISESVVVFPFSQLKHVAGQMVMQEGAAEGVGAILILSAEGVVKKT